MSLVKSLSLRFLRNLTRTPRGRAHVLAQVAEAESNGEIALFDRLMAQVEDPQLRKMIARHQSDEIRHEQLFRERLATTGIEVQVPRELQMITILDARTDGAMTRPIASDTDVMNAYLLLQVIEARAVSEFALMSAAFREVDPQTADVFDEVATDEARHLKYCVAIAKRTAPDDFTRERTLRRYQRLEAEAYRETSAANMNYLFANHIVELPTPVRYFWLGVQAVSEWVPAELAV